MAPSSSEAEALRSSYAAAGQEHVFTFFDSLPPVEQQSFFDQLLSINPERVSSIFRKAVQVAQQHSGAAAEVQSKVEPPPRSCVGSVIGNEEDQARQWNSTGLDAIRRGKVAVLLMAGGQGTRLGSNKPKGCYDIGLPSRKSLFQLQAERIRRLQQVGGGGAVVPWYIMTSGPTRRDTERFFEEQDYFGLKRENVVFFEQGVLPCLTNDGKFILDSKSSIAVAPDGNGGIYAGLRAPLSASSPASVLSDLATRGVEYIHAYGVDNCLVRVADPTFLGYCIQREADCGVKVVKKTDPDEAVGVVALKGGKFGVVEYSEIPVELSRATEEEEGSNLKFRAANIANHFYSRTFLEQIASFEHEMAYHIARKKIPSLDLASGEMVKPTTPNGMKLELFVFDVFPFTQRFAILEVERKTDFSPLKNAPGTGSDDPETSRRDLLAEQRRWLQEAGAEVDEGVEVELSPLVSYAGEGLEAVKGLKLVRSGIVDKVEDFQKLG